MKRWIYTLLISFCFTLAASAQQNVKQIESVKAAYITQRLELSTEESQRFWPIYNTYQNELQQLVVQKQKSKKDLKQDPQSFDELKLDTEILDLRKRYRTEFSKVLPKEKVTLLFQAEREFRQELIQYLNKRQTRN
jgi:Skp family chaperone for outer membrane proteins